MNSRQHIRERGLRNPILVPISIGVGLILLALLTPHSGATANPSCGGVHSSIVGTEDDNALRGASTSDVIFGGSGKDRIRGKGGRDRLCGGPGPDRLVGGPGKDLVNGGTGFDTCVDKTELDRMVGCERIVSAPAAIGGPSVTGLTLTPAALQGGVGVEGIVTISPGAPAGGRIVTLHSDNPGRASFFQSSVQVLPGLSFAPFSISTTAGADATVNVTATLGSSSFSKPLSIKQQVTLTDLEVPPSIQVNEGRFGTVTLDVPAAGFVAIDLQSSDPSSASVPASTTVGPGSKQAAFQIDGLQADPSVTITATLNTVSLNENVAIVP